MDSLSENLILPAEPSDSQDAETASDSSRDVVALQTALETLAKTVHASSRTGQLTALGRATLELSLPTSVEPAAFATCIETRLSPSTNVSLSAASPADESAAEGAPTSPTHEEPGLIDRAIDAMDSLFWEDFALLSGDDESYLYARSEMSDSYAHLLFLKESQNDLAAFIDRVRGESQLYPRPLKASSLSAAPLNIPPDRVKELYDIVLSLPDCSDIRSVAASNGDVYYYSSTYISEIMAQRSAERRSVERFDRL